MSSCATSSPLSHLKSSRDEQWCRQSVDGGGGGGGGMVVVVVVWW